MKNALILAVLCLLTSEVALAQGVAQSPSSTTVNQQRQNGSTVTPNAVTRTNPQGNTFNSPFSSPFGASGASNLPSKGGYAGNGVNR